MSFWDSIFGVLFGSRKTTTTRAPAPRPAPPPAPRPAPPPPPISAGPGIPTTPTTPPPAEIPTSPIPQGPVVQGPPADFALESLHAQNAAHLTNAQIDAAAQSLGVEANALRAVVRVESAGAGFGADGKPLILFEPYWFHELTDGRYDASHPNVSKAQTTAADYGRTQAERWVKLTEAYALAPDSALGATSWGAFQIPGRYYQEAGYPTVYAFVKDIAQSELNQLAAFQAYLQRQGLADELQRKDWPTFARAYEGEQGAGQYATALANAYAAVVRENPVDFIATLVAQSRTPLSVADYEAAASRLSCEREAVQAVVEVESGASGFAADGKPLILFEPHIFSRLTAHRFDGANPKVSYPTWDASKYPRDQAGRWAQLREAYGLDPENALASASYGRFQIMGMNYSKCGFSKASDFVADMAKSEVRQLAAFEAFVRSSNIADELQRKDWAGFARVYNGPGQVDRYGRLMGDAYTRLKATS
jgi:hypothetical protein